MKYATDTKTTPIRATYTTDCFRKIQDKDTGVIAAKRWVQEQHVLITLTIVPAMQAIFRNGARIA